MEALGCAENFLRIGGPYLYSTARLKEERTKNKVAKVNDGEVGFGDGDLNFDANLAKFGVGVPHLKSPHEEKRRFGALEAQQ